MTLRRAFAVAIVALALGGCTADAWRKGTEAWCRSAPNCDLKDLRSGETKDPHR